MERKTTERAVFGAGCFWGVEEAFRHVPGVVETRAGFAGGDVEAPTYEQVCGGSTGHAEVVEVRFDPARVSYAELLRFFWSQHDPTHENMGQYRSVVVCEDAGQLATAREVISELEAAGRFARPIATELLRSAPFYEAEEYHQQYYAKRERAVRDLKQRCGIE
jgi:peptide-methionine (S)-S-oxide reductase